MKPRGLLGLITFSEKRSEILILLLKKSRTLDDFKEYFNITSPEILPQLKKLENGGLIIHKDREYHLTEIGEILTNSYLGFFNTVKVFEDNMEFWGSHQIRGVPEELRQRLSMLEDYQIIKSSPTEIFKPHDEYIKNLFESKWIKGVSPTLHPEYPKSFLLLAQKGVKISLIVTEDVFNGIMKDYREEMTAILNFKNVSFFISDEKIKVAFTVSDSFMSMRFFLINGEYDFYKNIICGKDSALKFGSDMYKYFKKNARPVGPQDF